MPKTMSLLSISATMLAFCVWAGGAQAQATRTWVSGVGDDANPCSRTAPCKTFAGAISKTATGGEINCLDPGGFGGVTITKAIQIICQVEAGVLVSGTNAIIVNAPANALVLLDGLDIEGLGTGLTGVLINSAAHVTIRNTKIKNFTTNAIALTFGGGRLVLRDSLVKDNGGSGVSVGASTVAVVLRTTIDNQPTASISIVAGGTLILGESKLIGSATSVSNAGTFTSFGDNSIQTTGTPTNTINNR